MYASERQDEIRAVLREDGRVSVLALSERFDVTPETVRRDLDLLESEGLAKRVHGGAVLGPRTSRAEVPLVERSHRVPEAKQRIAARALQALEPGFRGSLYLDAGSTTAQVAANLDTHLAAIGGHTEVVTHSMQLAAVLSGAEHLTLTAIGGRVRGLTAAAVGGETIRSISALRPDIAFLGTNGLSADFGLSTPDPDEADVKTAIVAAGRRVIVLADAEKFEEDLLVRFASLSDIDVLVTDAAPPQPLADALDAAGVEVWLA
ncbi:DeoR/GlpR family DNA-binding transcription regulator [Microbacterium nymphoidis]|uniref:DeoR/GlpR family DNA-binding transcription regulator n=1 Tax=Microbacterium nymphoidis TaxID=2898586 RepID=UPI001E41140D|nr:DeoR/GlpR family DNA-binding transcription regulator [Microbacterium nymphoidis]MCD2498907.1 DeoR/GlpR family DNA-binding transcription regulator [Microbacterium nymphoidis]